MCQCLSGLPSNVKKQKAGEEWEREREREDETEGKEAGATAVEAEVPRKM